MKILVILGHPDKKSFCGAVAEAFATGAIQAGHIVKSIDVGEIKFDPILWHGFRSDQEFEAPLKEAQEALLWCERIVFVYPVWWGSVPALLKGFIDRTLTSGFAYKYREKSIVWDKLLVGRSAHLITTSDAPGWWLWLMYRNSDVSQLKYATLKFCGVTPVKVTRIAPVKQMNETQRSNWLVEAAEIGRNQF